MSEAHVLKALVPLEQDWEVVLEDQNQHDEVLILTDHQLAY
jgi:hypothetical protein